MTWFPTRIRFSSLIVLLVFHISCYAQSFTESFTSLSTLTSSGGWSVANRSTTTGDSTWRQGEDQTLAGGFLSFDNLSPNGYDYALCDFNSGTDVDTLSVWLFTPEVATLSNGDTFSFYTRTITGSFSPDRLQVRLSVNGNSTNVGTTHLSVGDFTYLLQDINPGYSFGVYPETWTKYTIILSGLPGGTLSGRFAFRYFAEDAGPFGSNSYAVGVDVAHYGDFVPVTTALTTGIISPLTYCVGETISVPYSSTGISFNTGNIFEVQMSDASGSFASPTVIGSMSSTASTGNITTALPLSTPAGSSYRIRVVASNPVTTGSSNTNDVTINALPSASITPTNPSFCPSSSVLLTASGGNVYTWSSGGNSATESINIQGTYTVTVTGIGSCTASASVSVTQNALPIADIVANGDTSFCEGSNVTLSASGGISFVWSTGDNTSSVIVDSSGLYTVTVSNTSGCTDTANQLIIVNANPPASVIPSGPTTICPGDSVTLTAGAGFSYLWSTSDTSASITAHVTGTYVVTITDINSCSSTATEQVTVQTSAATNITSNGPTQFCNGGNVTLMATNGDSYIWSTGVLAPSITTDSSGIYTVTVTFNGGCSASASQQVTVNNNPVASISATGYSTLCPGQTVTLTAGGTGTYEWSTGSMSNSININSPGQYGLTVTNSFNCTDSVSISFIQVQSPTATVIANGPTEICAGDSVRLTAGGGLSYAWSGGQNNISIHVSASGTYTVTVTDVNGCTATASQVVDQVVSSVSITPDGPTTFCVGGSVTLAADSSNSYLWSDGSNGNTITVVNAGVYSVTVTDSYNCTASASDTITLELNPVTSISIAGSGAICANGGNEILTAGPGNAYLWSMGDTTQSVTISAAGTYTVTVTQAGNCSASASQTITQANPIAVNGTTTGSTGNDGSINVTVSNGVLPFTFTWSNGSVTEDIAGLAPGIYSLTVTDANSCTATASFNISNVGLNDSGLLEDFILFPNPATDYVQLKLKLRNSAEGEIRVLDVLGKAVYLQAISGSSDIYITIPCSKWAAGIYQVVFSEPSLTTSKKIVIAR